MDEMTRLRFQLHSRTRAFGRKVAQAQALISTALVEASHCYIALSTGKDSLVVAHLVWEQQPDIPAVYFDADCAFPESSALLDRYEQAGRPIIRFQTEPLLDTFARLGGPTAAGIEQATMESTVYAPIKALLATHHFDGVFLGLRAAESYGRRKSAQVHGSLYRYQRDGVLRALPVARFTYEDIWAYIVSRGIDYNAVYDRMWDMPEEDRRVSYWAGETKRTHGRWAFLRAHYSDLFNRFAERFPEVRQFI